MVDAKRELIFASNVTGQTTASQHAGPTRTDKRKWMKSLAKLQGKMYHHSKSELNVTFQRNLRRNQARVAQSQ